MTDDTIDPALAHLAVKSPGTLELQTSDSPTIDLHADKYNDPRAKITSRGILLGVLVSVLAVIGAAASIYLRRVEKEQTTRFWGLETITALELAERIELLPPDGKTVELTATPGLGHLRRRLLEDSSFDWSTVASDSASQQCDQSDSFCVQLRLTDPTGHRVGTVKIDLDLNNGWVGPSDGSRRVRTTDRTRSALKHTLSTLMNVEQLRYDLRENELP